QGRHQGFQRGQGGCKGGFGPDGRGEQRVRATKRLRGRRGGCAQRGRDAGGGLCARGHPFQTRPYGGGSFFHGVRDRFQGGVGGVEGLHQTRQPLRPEQGI